MSAALAPGDLRRFAGGSCLVIEIGDQVTAEEYGGNFAGEYHYHYVLGGTKGILPASEILDQTTAAGQADDSYRAITLDNDSSLVGQLGPSARTERAVVTGLLALACLVAGYALHEAIEPSARQCFVAIHTADRLHIGMTNLLSTVRVRGDALGRTAYAEADAEVNQALDDVEPLDESYTAAANDCLGVRR